MPLVRVPAGIVRVPDGVTSDEIIRVVKERGLDKPRDSVTQAAAPPQLIGRSTSGLPSPRPEQSEFAKGINTGTDSLQGSLYGLAGLVGDTVGNERLTNWGIENYQRNVEEAGRAGLSVATLQDINDIGSFFDYASGALGQAVPSLASTAAGGGVGGVVGRAVAKKAAQNLVARGVKQEIAEKAVDSALKDPAQRQMMMSAMKRGALSGAFVASAGQQQGALYADLKEAGIEDAVAPAWAFGAAQGALDIVGEAALAKRLLPGQVEQELEKSLLRGLTKGTGRQAAIESGTEAAQATLGSMARILNGEDESWSANDTQDLLNNAAAGAIVGAVLGAPASVLERAQARKPNSEQRDVQRESAQIGAATAEPTQAATRQSVEATRGQSPIPAAGANAGVSPQNDRSPAHAVADMPSAEPALDIKAQLRDLADRNNPRTGVYLSAENMRQNRDLVRQFMAANPGFVQRTNADGKGGYLIASSDNLAEFDAAVGKSVPREQAIGRMTLSGEGKDPSATVVVQQKDADGAVTAESAVEPVDAQRIAQRFLQPGRTVEVTTPQAVIERREQLITMDDLSIPGSVQQLALVEQLRNVLPDNEVGRQALDWIARENQFENIGKARDAGRSTYQIAAAIIARSHGISPQRRLSLDGSASVASEPSLTPRQRLAMRDIQNLLAAQREAEVEVETTATGEGPQVSEVEVQDAGLTGSEAERPYRRIGAGDRMEGALLPGRGRIEAKPFADQASAHAVARRRQESDSDATYVAEQTSEGWFVNVYARPAAELTFNVNAGGPATVEQLTRLYIARASRRWDNLPRSLKESKGKTYGFKGVYVDAQNNPIDDNGKPKTINFASTEIVELGLAINPDLRKTGAVGLRDAFRLGLSHLMSREQDRIVPLSWTKEKPSFPRGLVLREAGRGLAEVTLGDAHRIAQQDAAAAIQEARMLGDLERSGAFEAEQDETQVNDETPVFERGTNERQGVATYINEPRPDNPTRGPTRVYPYREGSFDAMAAAVGDTRPYESEETQNRRSTGTFAPGGSVGTALNRGDSTIGSVTAGRASAIYNSTSTDNFVEVLMQDQTRAQRFGGMAKEIHRILKLRKSLVISDNKEAFVQVLQRAGLPTYADEAAGKIDNGREAAFVVNGAGGDTAYIFINPASFANTAQAVKSLAHELGHIFFTQHWGNTPNEMRKALTDAFETYLKQNPAFRRNLPYDKRMEEWIADNVAAWVATNRAPRTAVEKWFKDMADYIRLVWEAITQQFPLDLTVNEFINEMITSYDSRLDPAFDSLGAANDMFRDDEPTLREPEHRLRDLWTTARAWKAKHKNLGGMLDFVSESLVAMHNGLTASLQGRIRRMGIEAFDHIVSHFHLRAGESGGFTYDTSVANRMQNFAREYEAIVEMVDNEAGFLEAVRSERSIDSMQPEHQAAAVELRALMRRLYEYQVEAGLPIHEVPHYFPQVGDKEELLKPDAVDVIFEAIQAAGVKWQTSHGDVPITREMVQGWVESLGDDTYAVDFDPARIEDASANIRSPFVQALRARVLQPQVREVIRNIKMKDGPYKGQSRFYSKSLDEIMHRYIRQAVRRGEYNRIFGEDIRGIAPAEHDPRQLSRAWNPHQKFQNLMEAARKQGATPAQQELMYDATAAFMGNYQRIRSEPLKRLTKSVAFYQNLRTLLWVTISSFPEITTLFLRTGNFGDTWRSIRAAAADSWHKGGDTSKLLRAYGFAVDELDALAFKEFYDARDYDSKLNRLNEAWFRAIGLTRWTNFMRGLSLHVSLDYMKEHARRVADGFDSSGDSQRRLDELGISVDDLRVWTIAGEPVYGQAGVTLEDQRAGRSDLTSEQLEAIQRVTGAVTRMINEITINPTAAVKPLWRSSERWSLVSQLGSFTYGFANQVLGRMWHELSRTGAPTMARAAPLIALTMMIPVAALGLELKELFQYTLWGKEPRTDGMRGPEYIRTLIARTGILGVAQLGVDAYESASFGRDPIGVLTGPTLSQVNSAFRNIAQAEDTSRAVLKTTVGAIPFLSSTPGLREQLTP